MKSASCVRVLAALMFCRTLHAVAFAECHVLPSFPDPNHVESMGFTPYNPCCIFGDLEDNRAVPSWTSFTNNGETYQLKTWRNNVTNETHDIGCGPLPCTQCPVNTNGHCMRPPIGYFDMASHRLFNEFEMLMYSHEWSTGNESDFGDSTCECGQHGCGLLP